MRLALPAALLAAGFLIPSSALPSSPACGDSWVLPALARRAVAGYTEAVANLRTHEQQGLDAIFDTFAEPLDAYRAALDESETPPTVTPKLRAILDAIDAVAAQKDALWSRLFWHTDLDEALAEARATGKPVLSLRLLGRLDERLSCANSRFFRTTLYANKQISDELRDHFVLHWQSVRPVPRITIDYGDGRTIETTITGNSIHYILTPVGEVVDAFPGLYAPSTFLGHLRAARIDIVTESRDSNGESRPTVTTRPHWRKAAIELRAAWHRQSAVLGSASNPLPVPVADEQPDNLVEDPGAADPDAMAAALLTMGKSAVEIPVLRAIGFRDAAGTDPVTDADWSRLADGYLGASRLDGSSRSLVRAHMGAAGSACRGSAAATDTASLIDAFERSIALDTVRNEYLFRTKILKWLAADPAVRHDLPALNERIYAELFLTPSSDPWLGLAPAVYTAIPN